MFLAWKRLSLLLIGLWISIMLISTLIAEATRRQEKAQHDLKYANNEYEQELAVSEYLQASEDLEKLQLLKQQHAA